MIRPKRYLMKLAERELQLGDRTLIMGIINVTPDSFSDGGQNMDADRACERALELEAEGADIIDIGAESTRPGSERISEAEELRRLIPVLKKLRGKLSVPISVDTTKSAVAAKALETGAEIINDASTLTFDAELAKVVAEANAGLILNHMRGTPETWAKLGTMPHPMTSVMEDLEAGVSRARRSGVDRGRIFVDPGLGFGKRGEQNYELIARLGELAGLDLPVLVGPSRKSFLGQQEVDDADRATAAAVVAAVLHGAHIVRVHNVAAIRAVLQTADGILRSIEATEIVRKPKKAILSARDVEFSGSRAPESRESKPLRPPLPAPKEERHEFDGPPPQRSGYEDRPPRPSFRDRDGGGDRPPRPPFRDRGGDDRPPRPSFRDRDGGGDRPPRPSFRDREAGGDRPFRPSFRDRGGDDRPPRPSFRDRDGGGDRPPRRFDGGGDRPPYKKPFGDRPGGGGDRPPFKKTYGEKNAGDRPAFRKPFGSREGGGDRPPYKKPFGDRGGPGGDRPPFKKSFGGGGGRPGGFPKRDGGGFKPKGGPGRGPRRHD